VVEKKVSGKDRPDRPVSRLVSFDRPELSERSAASVVFQVCVFNRPNRPNRPKHRDLPEIFADG
jgi:hypothetical protein